MVRNDVFNFQVSASGVYVTAGRTRLHSACEGEMELDANIRALKTALDKVVARAKLALHERKEKSPFPESSAH